MKKMVLACGRVHDTNRPRGQQFNVAQSPGKTPTHPEMEEAVSCRTHKHKPRCNGVHAPLIEFLARYEVRRAEVDVNVCREQEASVKVCEEEADVEQKKKKKKKVASKRTYCNDLLS